MVLTTYRHHIEDLVNSHIPPENYLTEDDIREITEFVNENLLKIDLSENDIKDKEANELIDFLF